MNIAFIGAGRVARAFSACLNEQGFSTRIYGKDDLYSDYPGRIPNIPRLNALFEACDIAFITTPDDTIREVAALLASYNISTEKSTIAHMSGSLGSDMLSALDGRCRGIFSLHPMMSILGGPIDFSKVYFTLEGHGEGETLIMDMLSRIGASHARIDSADKALYHAASCFSANYTVTLMDIAKNVFSGIGIDEEKTWRILMPLMRQVLDNVEKNGSAHALTGPVSRGDAGTVRRHLAALDAKHSDYAPVYRFMGLETAKFAAKSGYLSQEKQQKLMEAFGQS